MCGGSSSAFPWVGGLIDRLILGIQRGGREEDLLSEREAVARPHLELRVVEQKNVHRRFTYKDFAYKLCMGKPTRLHVVERERRRVVDCEFERRQGGERGGPAPLVRVREPHRDGGDGRRRGGRVRGREGWRE